MVTFPAIDIARNPNAQKEAIITHHCISLRSMLLLLETLAEIKLSFFVDDPVPLKVQYSSCFFNTLSSVGISQSAYFQGSN